MCSDCIGNEFLYFPKYYSKTWFTFHSDDSDEGEPLPSPQRCRLSIVWAALITSAWISPWTGIITLRHPASVFVCVLRLRDCGWKVSDILALFVERRVGRERKRRERHHWLISDGRWCDDRMRKGMWTEEERGSSSRAFMASWCKTWVIFSKCCEMTVSSDIMQLIMCFFFSHVHSEKQDGGCSKF